MAKITGRNALVYLGTAVAPEKNQVTIQFNREMQEARVFAEDVPGGPWSDQIPGFRNWTVNINGYYDDTSGSPLIPLITTSALKVVVYETRTNSGRYWYGDAYFTITEEIGVDNIISVNISGTGTGALGRFPSTL